MTLADGAGAGLDYTFKTTKTRREGLSKSEVSFVRMCESNGWEWYHVGMPDFLVRFGNGQWGFVEAKASPQPIRQTQQQVLNALRRASGDPFLVFVFRPSTGLRRWERSAVHEFVSDHQLNEEIVPAKTRGDFRENKKPCSICGQRFVDLTKHLRKNRACHARAESHL